MFAFLFLQPIICQSVYAVELVQQNFSPEELPVMQFSVAVKKTAAKTLEPPKIDPKLAGLLQSFRVRPGDLQVVSDVNDNALGVIDYVKHRLAYDAQFVSVDEAVELMNALSVIKDEQALNILIELAQRYQKNTHVSQQVLLMLRDLPVTESVLAYVDNLIQTNRDNPQLIRSTLLYYIAVKHNAGMRWAAYYRSPGIDPQLRFAGMVLASTLSEDDQIVRWIINALKSEPVAPVYQQYYLLQALFNNVTEKEFDQLLTQMTLSPAVLKEFQRLRDYNKASGVNKQKLAQYMLASPHLDQQQAALIYYLNNNQVMDKWGSLNVAKRQSVIRLANKLDLPIFPKETVAPELSESIPLVLYVAAFFLIFLLIGYYFFVRQKRYFNIDNRNL